MAKRKLPERQSRLAELYTAFLARTVGEMPWDINCLTAGLGDEAQEKTGGVFMYVGDGGEIAFVYRKLRGGPEFHPVASALFSLDPLEPQFDKDMRERDARLLASGIFTFNGDFDSNEGQEALVRAALRLPSNNGVPLPLAVAWLITGISQHRHFDFWCFKEVPAVPVWDIFRKCVLRGVIGL